jgi:predicted nucleic acid-binding protein
MSLTNDRVFVDSNILIYSYSDIFIDKRDKARQVINSFESAYISTQVVNEFVSAFSKKMKAEWQDIIESLNEITDNFLVYSSTPDTVKHACAIALKYHFSFYDSLIIAAALECNCTILFSEDMQHGRVIENRLTIINPLK